MGEAHAGISSHTDGLTVGTVKYMYMLCHLIGQLETMTSTDPPLKMATPMEVLAILW